MCLHICISHKPKAPLQLCLWCQWHCAQGPHVCFFTIAAKELHICGGYSPATVVQRSPCRGPPWMLPLMWPCGTVHTHGRHIDSKEECNKNAIIFSQGAPVTGSCGICIMSVQGPPAGNLVSCQAFVRHTLVAALWSLCRHELFVNSTNATRNSNEFDTLSD